MIENFALVLVLVGCTIGAVLATLHWQTRQISRLNLALIRLNEQCECDMPKFLRAAFALLSQGRLHGMAWRLEWFGVPIAGREGVNRGETVTRRLHAPEIQLQVDFYLRRGGGERRYFQETLIETFMLLLRTDMLIKAGATDATFSQMARLNLFLQHDIKNVAQFIQLLADQLVAIPPGKELHVLDYLGTAAPLMRERADRIVHTLANGHEQNCERQTIALREKLIRLCHLHRLACRVEGDARVLFPARALDGALDNILKNYADISSRSGIAAELEIGISPVDDKVRLVISAPGLPPVDRIERLFEPFWSSHASGLGIGLYQARRILEADGGMLEATQDADQVLYFTTVLPLAPVSNNLHM